MSAARFCVLLTSDHQLAERARDLCKRRKIAVLAVERIDQLVGVVASVVPTHLVVDVRDRGGLDPEQLLGGHRSKVEVVTIDSFARGVDAFVTLCLDR